MMQGQRSLEFLDPTLLRRRMERRKREMRMNKGYRMFVEDYERMARRFTPGWKFSSPKSFLQCSNAWKNLSELDRSAYRKRGSWDYSPPTEAEKKENPEFWKAVEAVGGVGLRFALGVGDGAGVENLKPKVEYVGDEIEIGPVMITFYPTNEEDEDQADGSNENPPLVITTSSDNAAAHVIQEEEEQEEQEEEDTGEDILSDDDEDYIDCSSTDDDGDEPIVLGIIEVPLDSDY